MIERVNLWDTRASACSQRRPALSRPQIAQRVPEQLESVVTASTPPTPSSTASPIPPRR